MQHCIEQGSFSRGSYERQDYYLQHLGGLLTGAITPGHLDAPIINVQYGLWKFKNSFHNLLWFPLHGHWLCALVKEGWASCWEGPGVGTLLVCWLWGVQAVVPPWTDDPVTTMSFEATGKPECKGEPCSGNRSFVSSMIFGQITGPL